MRLSALAALMILTTVVLSACKQETVAALDDHSGKFFGRGYVSPYGTNHPTSYGAMTSGPAYVAMSPSMSAPTTSSVTMDSVSSSDLPPPAALQHKPIMGALPSSPLAPSIASSAWDWPVEGKVIQDFASQREGIVIAAKKGAPIHSVAGGEIAYVGSQLKDYGNLVIVRHPSGEMSSYAHATEIIVAKGDKVKQGDVLGYVGQTGRAPQPQLHFAIRSGDRTIDPLTRLPQRFASN